MLTARSSGPLIVTALLDKTSQSRFDAERQRYFPPSRNFLSAHVTLFHALPAGESEAVRKTLDAACEMQEPVQFATRGLRFLGRGVAYGLHMPGLVALRKALAAEWADWLTPQDQQAFQPHVTVQNKVSPVEAKALLSVLQTAYIPLHGEVLGLALWRYEGGPWSHVAEMHFRGAAGRGM